MNRLILTIPHSSIRVVNDGTINKIIFPKVQADALQCADLYTDILFDYDNAEKVICPISRMSIDVERYLDDSKEIMSKYGRGFIYKFLNDGHTIYRETIRPSTLDVYFEYHRNIKEKVEMIKSNGYEPFIIDCHSFNEEPFEFDLCKDNKKRDIDVCFGFNNKKDLPKNIFKKIEKWAKDNNYKYSFNEPYSGSMSCEGCKKSLMIELNKRIYLMKDNITPQPTMYRTQMQIKTLLDMLITE